MSYYHYLSDGDIVIDHGNKLTLKTLDAGAERLEKLGIQYLDCGTSGGVYGLDRGYCLMVGGTDHAVSICSPIFDALAPGIDAAPRTDETSWVSPAERGWLRCGGPGAGHFVKMVHNGVEYGIMQAYAEGFNILKEQMQEEVMWWKAMPRSLPCRTPKIISTILMCLRLLASVVVLLLVFLFLTLPLMFYGVMVNYLSSMGVSLILASSRWTVNAAVDLGVPAPVITTSFSRDSIRGG